MKKIILIFSLLLIATLNAEDSAPPTNASFLDDINGYLLFGEKLETESFIRRRYQKDECARYAGLKFEIRLIHFNQFTFYLAGWEETFMAGTRDLFFSAPVFQDYYLDLNAWQNVKFLKFGAEFCHFCGHYIDTMPPGDSVESWERLRLNFAAEHKWKKGIDYPAGNISAEIGLAKYFPLTDCDWRYGLNYNFQLSIFLTKAIHPFASLSNEIKFAAQSPRQIKPELRLGIIFKGKIINLALNSVMPLNDKSSGWEIKIFR